MSGVPAVADDQSPQKAHGLFGHLHIPRKYFDGCDDPEVYVAPVTGDCLAPDINDGDQALVSPATWPEPGDFVIVWPKGGSPKIKQLVLALPKWTPAPGSEVMPLAVLRQTNPPRSFGIGMDRVRAVHKVIGSLAMSLEPGWQDDGLYVVDWGDNHRRLEWIKVRTEKGAIRKEPLSGIRYSESNGNMVRRATIRFFAPSA